VPAHTEDVVKFTDEMTDPEHRSPEKVVLTTTGSPEGEHVYASKPSQVKPDISLVTKE
jgi:hypothetical protein